jgi:hypothetical protein
MPTARWIIKATNTHSEYVILIAFPPQQWLHERASILRKNCKLVALPNSIDFCEKVSRTSSHCKRLEDVSEYLKIRQPYKIRIFFAKNHMKNLEQM